MGEKMDILMKLVDLYKQATTERSHNYTGAVIKEAIEEITILRALCMERDSWQGWVTIIKAERIRQDAKWGEQNHDDHKWNTILCEEKGEVSKAILEHDGPGVLKELSHVAAVAVAWTEAIGRRKAE